MTSIGPDHAEPRIAVYLDYENLAIGARESLGSTFDFGVVACLLYTSPSPRDS